VYLFIIHHSSFIIYHSSFIIHHSSFIIQFMMDNLFDLKGKVALITGASKGIGEAMAHIFAHYGAKVVVNSRRQDAVDAVAAEIRKNGGEAIGIAGQVGNMDDLKQVFDKTIAAYGRLDILVNNAATNPVYGAIENTEPDVFDKIMSVNVKAPFELSKLAMPLMAKNGGGSIINISSIGGVRPEAGLGIYSVSKAALISLTNSLAKEWGQYNIRVNAICPGLIKTKFSKALWQDDKTLKRFTQHLPLKRMGTPEDLAGLALFLASDASAYCTGSTFNADGGFLI
jgi:NAD(P)-dependent dehydrogenase (short-subunit alcohol dehydrogenase family)